MQNANETFEKLLAEFDSAENITKALQQAAKKLPDHILCTAKFETKLVDDLSSSNIYAEDERMRAIIEEWHSFASLSSGIGDEYVITIQKSVLEPLKKLRQAFSDLRASIRVHDAIQLDVIKFQRKVAAYGDKEKTGANLVKLQECKQSLTASQREFANYTTNLINELSKFLAGSLEMLQPLLEGFIAAELAWTRACKRSLDSKSRIIDATTFETQSERLRLIEDNFRSMNSLSICSETRQ